MLEEQTSRRSRVTIWVTECSIADGDRDVGIASTGYVVFVSMSTDWPSRKYWHDMKSPGAANETILADFVPMN